MHPIQRSSCPRFRIRTNHNFPQILPRLCASHSCTRLRVNARSRNWHPIPIWLASNPSPTSIIPTPNIDSAFDWSNCIQRRVHWSCQVISKVHWETTGTWWLVRPKCTADLISCNCVSYLWKSRPFSAKIRGIVKTTFGTTSSFGVFWWRCWLLIISTQWLH